MVCLLFDEPRFDEPALLDGTGASFRIILNAALI